MKKTMLTISVVVAFALGAWLGSHAAKAGVTPQMWEGSPEEAAASLLAIAGTLAADGSWENIHVGRVYYLSGDTQKAEAIFDMYMGEKAIASDLVRIARVYAQAGEWDTAAPLFERVVKMKPKDADWLIEAGAYFNLNGDRTRAEELFTAGFALSNRDLNNTLKAAGSYVGVIPRRR